MTKIGLFFGSFNPIHIGHMIIASTMLENTDLQQIWFVVSPQNPLKKSKTLLHEFDRYEIVQRSVYDNYNFKVCDVEFHLPKPGFTIDTLTYLQEKHKDDEFVLIIGEDNLVQFPQWKNYDKILEYFSLYVYPRPNAVFTELKNHPKVRMVPSPLLDISATYIRECIKNGKSIKYLVPEAVESYIRQKGFYL
ncbi:MAG: nicotinate (nicotinamide) nucleotide adenylyltransferase [Cytophagaceae bacterium]